MSETLNTSINEIASKVNDLWQSPKSENSMHKQVLFDPLCEQLVEITDVLGLLDEKIRRLEVITETLGQEFEKVKAQKVARNGKARKTTKKSKRNGSGSEETDLGL